MTATMPHPQDERNHHATLSGKRRGSLPTRLARRWGASPQRAKWLAYHMERGIRGQCLDVLAELGPEKFDVWIAPVDEAREQGAVLSPPEAIQAMLKIDNELNATLGSFLLCPTSGNKKALLSATRRTAGASRQLARSLEAMP